MISFTFTVFNKTERKEERRGKKLNNVTIATKNYLSVELLIIYTLFFVSNS